METLADIRQAIEDDLTVGSESTLYSTALINRAINRAYRKAGSLFQWPELKDAKKTTTQVNQEYYDYPSTWRSDSIWKIRINNIKYGEEPDGSPLSFDDYLNWREDYPDYTDKKWANHQRRFFVTPTPTVAGLVVCIWGFTVTETLTSDSNVTIFSYSMPEGNEAIVLEAVAILKAKGENEKAGEFRSMEAKQILATAWGRIRKEQAKYEKNMPFLDVPDFFGGTNSKDLRGRFDI